MVTTHTQGAVIEESYKGVGGRRAGHSSSEARASRGKGHRRVPRWLAMLEQTRKLGRESKLGIGAKGAGALQPWERRGSSVLGESTVRPAAATGKGSSSQNRRHGAQPNSLVTLGRGRAAIRMVCGC